MESKNTQPVYSKQQLLTFQRYAARRDLLEALLSYTHDQVRNLIDDFMKGKVRE